MLKRARFLPVSSPWHCFIAIFNVESQTLSIFKERRLRKTYMINTILSGNKPRREIFLMEHVKDIFVIENGLSPLDSRHFKKFL